MEEHSRPMNALRIPLASKFLPPAQVRLFAAPGPPKSRTPRVTDMALSARTQAVGRWWMASATRSKKAALILKVSSSRRPVMMPDRIVVIPSGQ